ncbi:hypothetical protein EC968_001846 [Mortierella alpina]|nr:hypothetical protein EC968_001846 [Mortierella alpina]
MKISVLLSIASVVVAVAVGAAPSEDKVQASQRSYHEAEPLVDMVPNSGIKPRSQQTSEGNTVLLAGASVQALKPVVPSTAHVVRRAFAVNVAIIVTTAPMDIQAVARMAEFVQGDNI